MPCYGFETSGADRVRARFEAKLAAMKARGVRVLVGSTLWHKLAAAARR